MSLFPQRKKSKDCINSVFSHNKTSYFISNDMMNFLLEQSWGWVTLKTQEEVGLGYSFAMQCVCKLRITCVAYHYICSLFYWSSALTQPHVRGSGAYRQNKDGTDGAHNPLAWFPLPMSYINNPPSTLVNSALIVLALPHIATNMIHIIVYIWTNILCQTEITWKKFPNSIKYKHRACQKFSGTGAPVLQSAYVDAINNVHCRYNLYLW